MRRALWLALTTLSALAVLALPGQARAAGGGSGVVC